MTRRSFCALSALPLAAGFRGYHGRPRLSKEFLAGLPRLLELASVPSVGYALIEDGRVSATALPDALFQAASLTKPVFTIGFLKLGLPLDEPLDRHTPMGPDERARKVTPRHVLSHSTGFPNWRYRDEPLACSFDPGEKFGYSGEGFYALQQLVAKTTGTAPAAWLRQTVLDPLGLKATTLAPLPEHETTLLRGHDRRGQPLPQRRGPSPDSNVIPMNQPVNAAASLRTTPAEYARFLLAMMDAQAMWKPTTRLRGNLSWGLGTGLENGADGLFAWHWGDNPGFKNFYLVHAKSRSGIVVFTNGDGGAKVYQRIVQHALGRDFEALVWV